MNAPACAEDRHPRASTEILKKQIFFSALANLAGASLFFLEEMPFSRALPTLALFSAVMYGVYYVILHFSERYRNPIAQALSLTSFVVLGMAVHVTGGIASPFVFLYFCILISETIYAIKTSVSLPLAAASYSIVVGGEFLGLLPVSNPWSAQLYRSTPVTLVILSATVTFMCVTNYLTALIVVNLRRSLEQEREENDALIKKFSELNSTAQLGVLAHRIVHDLRGPLGAISGYIQLALAKGKDKEDKEMLAELHDMVLNMAESVNGITRFGKSRAVSAENIQLSDFMSNLLAIAEYSPHARGVKFVRRFDGNLPLQVTASRADLQQAYFNILKNAVEAVRDNADAKVVEIEIKAEGASAEIRIADNGPGIVPEILSTLFRKSITTKKDGTGVGLLITRDLLSRNDGYIEINNRPEGGLTVMTRLPLAQGSV